jgi:hypothetical protein
MKIFQKTNERFMRLFVAWKSYRKHRDELAFQPKKNIRLSHGDLASAGNVYRHEYHRVDVKELWDTVTESLNELLLVVQAELTSRNP